MCLAVPMQIRSIGDHQCVCEARGVERKVSLLMMQGENLASGDYVLVHAGLVVQKIDASYARTSWQLIDEILAADA